MGPDYCKVKIYLRDLDIEPSSSGNCDKDVLMIGDQRICGQEIQMKESQFKFTKKNSLQILLFCSDFEFSTK